MEGIEVHLNADEQREAIEAQLGYDKVKGGLSSRIETQKNKDAIGASGEIAFRKYLIAYKIPFTEHKREYTRGGKDSYDFIVNNIKLDIKTSKKWRGIFVNERQLHNLKTKKIQLLVGVHYIRPEVVTILGKASPKDFERSPELDTKDQLDREVKMYSIPDNKIIKMQEDGAILS